MGFLHQSQRIGSQIVEYGPLGVFRKGTKRLAQRASTVLDWDELDFPLRPGDVRTTENAGQPPGDLPGDDKLRIGWVCMPPASGSGGHTTLFRMVEAMESRGHECTVLLYDRNSDDVTRHEGTIRRAWPGIRAHISSATNDLGGLDAIVASSWATAHVVANRSLGDAKRFYFIQDYEPYFYPKGYLYTLAESTYRFGFHNIALGEMVAHELRTRSGVEPSIVVPFGCDRTTYRILARRADDPPRSGVAYYAKQSVDRRGYTLARATLERFHELCPHEPIHVVGDRVRGWNAPIVNHGSMRPEDLNVLYNATVAGLAMSFTNVSLVPGELLAAGNIPVLNDAVDARKDLTAGHAVWAEPTPEALARALAGVVSSSAGQIVERATNASYSAPPGWEGTTSAVTDFIEKHCYSQEARAARTFDSVPSAQRHRREQ